MKTFVAAIGSMMLVAGVAASRTTVSASDAATVATIEKLENELVAGAKAGDAAAFERIIADDWTAIGPDGSKLTKANLLAGYKERKSKLDSFEFGPLDVKVLGDVAVIQGSDTEKSSYDGNDTSGKYVWTSVFAKRAGKWVAVRGQINLVK
jgi:ketosteroid isomerase-like protein